MLAEPCGAVAVGILVLGGANSYNTFIDGMTGVNPLEEAIGETLALVVDVGVSVLFIPKRGADTVVRILKNEPGPGAVQKVEDIINSGQLGATLGED